MSEEIDIERAANGDPYYTEYICQRYVIELGWSRKRRKKWLRRLRLKLAFQNDPLDF